MEEIILELQQVYFSYESHPNAINNISVSFRKGEQVAVLGNNGAGKSTFFLNCNGVLHPEKGKIIYKGKELKNNNNDMKLLRKHVGLVFQEPDRQLIAPTVESEISFGPMNLQLDKNEVTRRVEQNIVNFKLQSQRKRPPHYLSGGEKRKVTIADVLAMEPEIILFDEPTSSLDPQNVDMLEGILEQLHSKGITLIISTHDVDFAWKWSKRILLFSSGKIIADGPSEKIFASENLLNLAGLKQPHLFTASQLLKNKGIIPTTAPLAKTIEQLEESLA